MLGSWDAADADVRSYSILIYFSILIHISIVLNWYVIMILYIRIASTSVSFCVYLLVYTRYYISTLIH